MRFKKRQSKKKYSTEKRKLFRKVIGNFAIRLFAILDEEIAKEFILKTENIPEFFAEVAIYFDSKGVVGDENEDLKEVMLMLTDIINSESKYTPAKGLATSGEMLLWLKKHAESLLYKHDLAWNEDIFQVSHQDLLRTPKNDLLSAHSFASGKFEVEGLFT